MRPKPRESFSRGTARRPSRGAAPVRSAAAPLAHAGLRKAPPPEAAIALSRVRQILVCRPNSRLGNAVLMTPLVAEIQARLPQARVHMLSGYPGAAELFGGFSCVAAVHGLPYHGARHPIQHVRTLLQAAATHYDLIIDPDPDSWTSRFITRLLRADLKIGFSSVSKTRGTDINVPFERAPRHMGTYPVYLFRRAVLGLDEKAAQVAPPRLSIRLKATEREAGRQRLRALARGPGPIIAIAGAATGAKQLETSWWREMLRALMARLPGIRIIEIRPPSDVAAFPEYPGYSSTRVREVAAVIGATDCFVCADSGLMHLGSASQTATVGLFRVTSPEMYAPYGGASIGITVGADGPATVATAVARVTQSIAHRP